LLTSKPKLPLEHLSTTYENINLPDTDSNFAQIMAQVYRAKSAALLAALSHPREISLAIIFL